MSGRGLVRVWDKEGLRLDSNCLFVVLWLWRLRPLTNVYRVGPDVPGITDLAYTVGCGVMFVQKGGGGKQRVTKGQSEEIQMWHLVNRAMKVAPQLRVINCSSLNRLDGKQRKLKQINFTILVCLSFPFNLNLSFTVLFLASVGPECSKNFTSNSGIIKSPGFPEKYPNNLDCTFMIFAPKMSEIILEFENFELEPDTTPPTGVFCRYDRLEIWDGFPGGEQNRQNVEMYI